MEPIEIPLNESSKSPFASATSIQQLGNGSFGSVLKITKNHDFFGLIDVAVKFIPLGNLEKYEDDKIRQYMLDRRDRILREVHNAVRVEHPNSVFTYKYGYLSITMDTIVQHFSSDESSCYDFDASRPESTFLGKFDYNAARDGFAETLWIQMDLCGPNLRSWLNQNQEQSSHSMQLLQLGICKGLVEGVKFLHNRNVIHRDLKPENIFFSNHDGFVLPVKIGDLGLSRRLVALNDQNPDESMIDGGN